MKPNLNPAIVGAGRDELFALLEVDGRIPYKTYKSKSLNCVGMKSLMQFKRGERVLTWEQLSEIMERVGLKHDDTVE